MCSLVIIVWTETVKDEEQTCKEKSACELSVLFLLLLLPLPMMMMMIILFHFFICV